MKKVRVLTAEEAALLVNDGDTIATGGFVSCACPEALVLNHLLHPEVLGMQ